LYNLSQPHESVYRPSLSPGSNVHASWASVLDSADERTDEDGDVGGGVWAITLNNVVFPIPSKEFCARNRNNSDDLPCRVRPPIALSSERFHVRQFDHSLFTLTV